MVDIKVDITSVVFIVCMTYWLVYGRCHKPYCNCCGNKNNKLE